MKKMLVGFVVCVLLLGCVGCSGGKKIDMQGTGTGIDAEKDTSQEEPNRFTQSDIPDSEVPKTDDFKESQQTAPWENVCGRGFVRIFFNPHVVCAHLYAGRI